jgi:hypothetical protein
MCTRSCHKMCHCHGDKSIKHAPQIPAAHCCVRCLYCQPCSTHTQPSTPESRRAASPQFAADSATPSCRQNLLMDLTQGLCIHILKEHRQPSQYQHKHLKRCQDRHIRAGQALQDCVSTKPDASLCRTLCSMHAVCPHTACTNTLLT